MLTGKCPYCGAANEFPRAGGVVRCAACAGELRIVERAGAWVLQQRQPPRRVAPDDRLVWFEMQITPAHLRLAVVPDQPVLFGETVGGITETFVIERAADRERFLAGLEYLVHTLANLFALPEHNPAQAFDEELIRLPGVHIRAACADGRQWASAYHGDAIPGQVAVLFETVREYAWALLERLAVPPRGPGDAAY